MVTEKDLVAAHVFQRRRLTRAFVSGASARSDSARPGRALAGGLVLAALLVVGAACGLLSTVGRLLPGPLF